MNTYLRRRWHFAAFLGVFLLAGMHISCSKVNTSEEEPNGRIFEIYTNYPGIKPGGHKPPEFDIRLAQFIDGARKEVYWAMYGFYRTSIKDAVLRAVTRGLDVQLAGDAGTYSYGEIGYVQFEDLLRRYPNAKLIAGNSQSIQHNKFCVIDRRYVMTGTGNITDSEIDRNYNVWTIIESKEMAEDFIAEHQQMMQGRFGHAKDPANANHVFNVNGIKVEAYFSPAEDAMSRFLQAVGEAQQSINFAIFAFTHDQLGRLFIQKHKQFTALNAADGGSRKVRGIMDRSQLTHNQYVEVYRVATSCGHTYGFQAGAGAANGGTTNAFFPNGTNTWNVPDASNTRCYSPFDLKIDGDENNNYIGDWQAGGGRLHAKTIVIDAGTPNAKLLLGSFNWSPNANNNNDENLIVIHSPAIVERYLQFWQGIYNDGVPMNKRYPTNNEMSQGIVTYQSRPAGDYQKVVISEVNFAGTTRKINGNYYAYDGNEFIELYNPTNEALDISFWSLYFPIIDNYTDPGIYTSGWPDNESLAKRGLVGLPGGTIIPAKGFLVVTQSDQRNDITADGYSFPASALYDPSNSATWSNKISHYNPVNGLSNFFTLFDRRTSSTGRANVSTLAFTDPFTGKNYPPASGGILTFVYPMFDAGGRCRPAWGADVDRFSGSGYFNPYHMHADSQTGYPHLTSLWVELRDNRGNLVDIVGGNRTGAAVNGTGTSVAPTASSGAHDQLRYFKGGFHGLIFKSGTTAAASAVVTSIGSTTNLQTGMLVFGSGITNGTTLQSIDSATQITLSANATSSSTKSLTFQTQLVGSGTYGTTTAVDTTDATRTDVASGISFFPQIARDNFPVVRSATGTKAGTTISALPAGFATTYLTPGMAVSGTGITAGTTIQSVDSGTQITITQSATAGTTTISFSAENYADLLCNTAAANTPYMVSMERAPTFGDGTATASWVHATKDMTTSGGNGGKGVYIKTEYRDRTIATPGEINSRWTALP